MTLLNCSFEMSVTCLHSKKISKTAEYKCDEKDKNGWGQIQNRKNSLQLQDLVVNYINKGNVPFTFTDKPDF